MSELPDLFWLFFTPAAFAGFMFIGWCGIKIKEFIFGKKQRGVYKDYWDPHDPL